MLLCFFCSSTIRRPLVDRSSRLLPNRLSSAIDGFNAEVQQRRQTADLRPMPLQAPARPSNVPTARPYTCKRFHLKRAGKCSPRIRLLSALSWLDLMLNLVVMAIGRTTHGRVSVGSRRPPHGTTFVWFRSSKSSESAASHQDRFSKSFDPKPFAGNDSNESIPLKRCLG